MIHRSQRTGYNPRVAWAASLLLLAFAGFAVPQTVTRAPAGPLRVDGARLVDSAGQPVLLRGTQVPGLSHDSTDFGVLPGHRFGALSATTLNAIRQRWNMNVIRLPVDVVRYTSEPSYPARLEQAVRNANRQDLLVILAATEPATDLPSGRTLRFWTQCAARFRNYPRLLFDVYSPLRASTIPGHIPGTHTSADWRFWRHGGNSADGRTIAGMQQLADAIRATGAAQPIIVRGLDDELLWEGLTPEFFIAGANIVYEADPRFNAVTAGAQRDRYFGFLAGRVPVLVNDWDLNLNKREDCLALPQDPGAVERLIESGLEYFDRRGISWTISAFAPGKLITDYRHFYATTLDNGLPCGSSAGMGLLVQYHLIEVAARGLVTTCLNATFVLARGGVAQTYGPILSDAESDGRGALPTKLANISVQITDSRGVAQLAPLLHVGAGWSFVNFIVPPQTAKGPARVALVRSDRSKAESKVLIDDVSPALLTGAGVGWGPVIGEAMQTPAAGAARVFATYQCGKAACTTVPIVLSEGVSTTVRLLGTGFRNTAAIPSLTAEIGGVAVPVLSFGPSTDPGADQVTLSLPPTLRGAGETDVMLTVDGHRSNVARINVRSGGAQAVRKISFSP